MGQLGRDERGGRGEAGVTVAGKEDDRCCGVEIGHGDVGSVDMGLEVCTE